MNHFKKDGPKLLSKGIVALPSRYMSKAALLKGWQEYFEKKPTEENIGHWCNLKKANLDILLGKCSNIVALDFDCDDPELQEFLVNILPKSPVEKRSNKKGRFTRFFKYSGESSDMLRYRGTVVLELLSDGKKTTMGTHPNGADYQWVGEKTLMDDVELPILPPVLLGNLETMLATHFGVNEFSSTGKIVSGRNDALSQYVGKLMSENQTIDTVLTKLIQFDKENHEVPMFEDPEENRHTEPYTNALQFFANHLSSFNYRRMNSNEAYVVPVMEAVTKVTEQQERELGKSQSKESKKKLSQDFLLAPTVLKSVQKTILKNSWIKQPELAFGASLALMATLTSRKFVYQGISPNLYILNISESGTGKDMPMKFVKNTLAKIGAHDLLGAGDYVSDASLMDSLPEKPTRLDVMDEMGGILRSINKGKSEYNSKMADVLAELYTTSNDYYMGRAMASGFSGGLVVKGACYRPNVNILGSTTPAGFKEGVTKTAIDKGLLGRFLVFTGNKSNSSTRVKNVFTLNNEDLEHLTWLNNYIPEESGVLINNINQRFTELTATPEADTLLDKVFKECDDKRIAFLGTTEGPIISRLYQQMIKLTIIHAASRCYKTVPVIDVVDVEFGRDVILQFANQITEVVKNLIFNSKEEKERHKLYKLIHTVPSISKKELIIKTPGLNKKTRDSILEELKEAGQIEVFSKATENGREIFYQKGPNE